MTDEKNDTPVEDTLLKALHGVQSEALKLTMDATADVATKTGGKYQYRYLTLEKLMETILPALTRHGLVWVTLPCRDEHGDPALRYELIHAASGEKIAETMPLMLTARDPQGLGSAVTYSRRYSLLAVLGLAPDEDDDGKAAGQSGGTATANGGAKVTARPPQDTERIASAKQRGLINGKAGEKGLPPDRLANIVLAASESEVVDFESQSAAEDWLRRALDRLPARLVNPILEGIEKAEAE